MPEWNSFEAFLDEAQLAPTTAERRSLVSQLLEQRPAWPWIEGRRATFIFAHPGTHNVALNLDTIKADPPFAPMENLDGTTLWYVTREFASDDLLDYMLAVNDPMTPLAQETDIVGRVNEHWQYDPRNPLRMQTAQLEVSVLRMPDARPFPDWTAMPGVPRGRLNEHTINSRQLGFQDRKLWVYTPPEYDNQPHNEYPLLILMDGQWCSGPLQVPQMADALIKHRRLAPVIIAMIQSGSQENRAEEFISNDRHYTFLLTELLPMIQAQYRVNPLALGVGGVAMGASAAAHAALMNPSVFQHLIMISPPLDRGENAARLQAYTRRFANAEHLPQRIFQSVGRYEIPNRFLKPGRGLRDLLAQRHAQRDTAYEFVEIGCGHGLVGFKAVFPEALAWTFPRLEG